MAATPALARVVRTSYLNDMLIEVEHGSEGPLVAWPAGVSIEDAGDNLIACDGEGKPIEIVPEKKK